MDSLEREAQERKKKAIALGSLPLCLGFFVWRVQSTSSAAPPPKPPQPSVVAKAAPAVAAAAGPVLTLQKTRIVSVPLSDRDPFKAVVDLNPPAPVESKSPEPKPVVTEIRHNSLMGMTLPPLKPFGEPPAGQVQPAPAAPAATTMLTPAHPAAPVMPYVLTGIVKGFPDVAVLRHADGTRRIARVGDRLDSKYRLASIGDSSVVLESASGITTLNLGGDLPVAPALNVK